MWKLILFVAMSPFWALGPVGAPAADVAEATAEAAVEVTSEAPVEATSTAVTHWQAPVEDAVEVERYGWLDGMDELPAMQSLAGRFSVPEGYARVDAADGSYADWLRGLPVRTDRDEVFAFDGRTIDAPAAAVIVLDVGDRNLQQCADSAIRLHAEYAWSIGAADEIGYHFTSGDYSGWEAWRKGERLVVEDGDVVRKKGKSRSATHENFRRYLTRIFIYAGTRSLKRDTQPVDPDEPIMAGDVFNQGGSPGHAIVVLDVAEDADGQRIALLGQGFMPAQEMHVLESSNAIDGVWFVLPEAGEALDTPSWYPFDRTDAIRFSL